MKFVSSHMTQVVIQEDASYQKQLNVQRTATWINTET